MNFSAAKYKRACAHYRRNWDAVETALYGLCRRYPNHKSRAGINAKLWIIVRAYATGIERKIKSQGVQGSSMTQLGDHFWRNRRRVDAVLRGLRSVKEPLTTGKLTKILAAHARLVRLIKPVLRKRQTPRSFVSKYLHFHNSAVPICDSVAARAVRGCYRRMKRGTSVEIPAGADPQYADFLLRFWQLYQDARASRVKVSVKLLDHYLLSLAMEEG